MYGLITNDKGSTSLEAYNLNVKKGGVSKPITPYFCFNCHVEIKDTMWMVSSVARKYLAICKQTEAR